MSFKIRDSLSSHSITITVVIITTTITITVIVNKMPWRHLLMTHRQESLNDYACLLLWIYYVFRNVLWWILLFYVLFAVCHAVFRFVLFTGHLHTTATFRPLSQVTGTPKHLPPFKAIILPSFWMPVLSVISTTLSGGNYSVFKTLARFS